MMPTSPSAPDPAPDVPLGVLDSLPTEEQAALARIWQHAGQMVPPEPDPARKDATWVRLQGQIQQTDAPPRRPADRPALRRRPRVKALAATGVLAGSLLALLWIATLSTEQPSAPLGLDTPTTTARTAHLPDGTQVDLQPGATLHPSHHSGAARSYRLSGTARFDVFPDAARPFTVETAQATVTVLGTVFEVEADDTTRTRVRVHEGRVAVTNPAHERVELRGGEQALAARDVAFTARPLPASPDAVFRFSDAALDQVLREIELVFGVRVTAPAPLGRTRLTITRHGPLDLHDLLQSVCAPLGLRYRSVPGGYELYRPG